ncbi:hypothetical protein EBZ39_04935 [bacterium]|nr:hypothetical protein [bacterium]
MQVVIYGIGGAFNDDMVGVAYDPVTALSLLRLLRENNCTGCSLHGHFRDGEPPLSGEMSLRRAEELFYQRSFEPPANFHKARVSA